MSFLLISTSVLAQKKYTFDYLITYNKTVFKDKKSLSKKASDTQEVFYLTNSKDNSYAAILTHKDSLSFTMDFKDENGIVFKVFLDKKTFFKTENINVDCAYVSTYSNPYKSKAEEYQFSVSEDTIIENIAYKKYKLASIVPIKKRKKIVGSEHFIISNDNIFHLPILSHPTAYEVWKLNPKSIPLGFYKEKSFLDFYNRLEYTEKLKEIAPIDLKIYIPEDCDYTSKKFQEIKKLHKKTTN